LTVRKRIISEAPDNVCKPLGNKFNFCLKLSKDPRDGFISNQNIVTTRPRGAVQRQYCGVDDINGVMWVIQEMFDEET